MSKQTISATIDTNTLQTAKALGINRSQILEKALKTHIATLKNDGNTIDLELLNQEIPDLQAKMMDISLKLQEKTEKKREIMQKIKQKERCELLHMKENIEKRKKCYVCTELFEGEDKITNLKNDMACHNKCLMENYKKLKKEGLIK